MNEVFVLAKKISQKDFLREGATGVKGKKRLKAVSLKRRLAKTGLPKNIAKRDFLGRGATDVKSKVLAVWQGLAKFVVLRRWLLLSDSN